MAGDWIKWSVGLCQKPEIMQMSARLLMPPAQTAGTLMLVMEWIDGNVRDLSGDGDAHVRLLSMPTNFLDTIVGVAGFTESMAEVGWITHKDGILTFVNVGKHNGKSAKSRALDRERKREDRQEESPVKVRNLSGSKPDTIRTREEKRREEIPIPPVSPKPSKTSLQIRIESWFHRRSETPWGTSELRAWDKNQLVIEASTPEELDLLAKRYDGPEKDPYCRRDIATLLNNWTGEIDRARNNSTPVNGRPIDPRANILQERVRIANEKATASYLPENAAHCMDTF